MEDLMVDWRKVSLRLGYHTEREMWLELYIEKKMSIPRICLRLGVSRTAVVAALRRNRVKIRPRGGANNRKIRQLTPEEARLIECEGIMAASRRLQVSYISLYKEVRKRRPRTS
jgi:hypothetical protein